MNCIIIDDDVLSRKIIEEFIARTDSLTLINSFTSAVDAINSINNLENKIELIFLDIEMPEMTGIEFINNFDKHPQIIIISSKEKYAIKAFEYDVTDYILKPATYARFYKAITKAIDKDEIFKLENKDNDKGISSDSNEIFIKKNSTLVRISYDDILYVEAMENYIVIITGDDKFTIHFTMKALSDKLPSDKFKRIHRSYIVNANKIKGIDNNSVIIELGKNAKKVIPIGKSYKEHLLKDLNLITK